MYSVKGGEKTGESQTKRPETICPVTDQAPIEYCPIAACVPEREPEPFPPEFLEELQGFRGKLLSVDSEFARGLVVARIGRRQVMLPAELEEKLRGLIGKKVHVAKIEGKCYAAERKPARLRL